MRIAFLVGEFPSVSETFILSQIVGLIELGHHVDIYASRSATLAKIHPDVETYNLCTHTYYHPRVPQHYIGRFLKVLILLIPYLIKYPLITLNSLNFWRYKRYALSLRLFYDMTPFLDQNLPHYDAILCHFGGNGLKGMVLRELGAIHGKLCTTFHGLDISGYLQEAGESVYDRLFQTGDLFLPISDRWKQRLLTLGCDSKKMQVHHMGIDVQQFTFRPRQLQPNQPVRILTVARLVEKKGVEYGIRAIAQLSQQYPNLLYTIVGDGPLREQLTQLIAELNIGDRVQLLGWKQQDEVVEILHHAALLLAPSVTAADGDQEGIPVALMEAMAMGLPVISTQHSGIPELVEHGISGLLAPERDVVALAQQIHYLIDHPEIWQVLSCAARLKVEREYNIQPLNQRLVELLQQGQSNNDSYSPLTPVSLSGLESKLPIKRLS